jgi:hypothetical protein
MIEIYKDFSKARASKKIENKLSLFKVNNQMKENPGNT